MKKIGKIMMCLLVAAVFVVPLIPLENMVEANNSTDYKLLIIGPDEFADEMIMLRDHKDSIGIPALVVGLKQIDTMWGNAGVDEPEQIKKCIEHYEKEFDIEYVLLVGDCDKFPVRYTASCVDYADEPVEILFANTDLYYADLYYDSWLKLFDDWNSRKQGIHMQYFGEVYKKDPINYDNFDGFPDIAVGRIPASTANEVETYVKKVINYELNYPTSKNVFIAEKDGVESTQESLDHAKDLAEHFKKNGFLPEVYYFGELEKYNTADKIVASNQRAPLINGYLSMSLFASFWGHASPTGWSWYDHPDLNTLSNKDNLPIIFSNGCDIARFAPKEGEPYIGINGDEWWRTGQLVMYYDYDDHSNLITIHSDEKYDSTKTTEIRLAQGDIVDSNDNQQEAVYVVETYEEDIHKVALMVYHHGSKFERQGFYLKRFENAYNPDVATGNFDTDPEDEVAVTYEYGNGNVIISFYDLVDAYAKTTGKKYQTFSCVGSILLNDCSHPRVTTGDFTSDSSQDELVVSVIDGNGKLAIFTYEINKVHGIEYAYRRISDIRLDITWREYLPEDTFVPMVAAGNLDSGDPKDEIVTTFIDEQERLAVLAFDFLGPNNIVRIGDIRLEDAQNADVTMGDFNNDQVDDIVVTFEDGLGRVGIHVYNYNNAQPSIDKRLQESGDVRLNDASNPTVSVGNFDSDSSKEIAVFMIDGSTQGAVFVYDYVGINNLKRLSSFREKQTINPFIPLDIVCGNFDHEINIDEIVTYFYRSAHILPNPPVSVQPSKFDVESMAEDFLVKSNNGAIVFIGSNTGAQEYATDLGDLFFEAYLDKAIDVVGDMWNYAVAEYYKVHDPATIKQVENCLEDPNKVCYYKCTELYQPAKLHFFGDPSIVVGGLTQNSGSTQNTELFITHDTTMAPIEYNNVTIKIMNSDIVLDCNGATIQGRGTGSAIEISKGINDVTIKNGIIKNYNYGIHCSSNNNKILNNLITSNKYGLNLNSCEANKIENNSVTYNEYGMGLYDSSGNSMVNNILADNTEEDIYLSNSPDNTIFNNAQYKSPIASFEYSPKSPVEVNTTVFFTDTSVDTDGIIEDCTWYFEDGTVVYETATSYTFTEAGEHSVTVTVTDDDGATARYTATIEVTKEDVDDNTPGFTLLLCIAAIFIIIQQKKKGGKK